MKSTHALPIVLWSLLIVSASLTGCDEGDETDGAPAADTSGISERDVRSDVATPDASESVEPDITAADASTDVTIGGYSARYSELLAENFDACVSFCQAWEACGEALLADGETCDDFCEVDADILRANIPDQADGYECMAAGIAAYGCNAGLSCDEVTEYVTDEATTLCATEDADFGTFCSPFF